MYNIYRSKYKMITFKIADSFYLSNVTAETKLAILAFLYCREFRSYIAFFIFLVSSS